MDVSFATFAEELRSGGRKAYTLKNFVRFCSYLRTEDGKPLKVEGFQRKILRDHFAGAAEVVVVLSKKNGKTTLFSALALFHLLTWEDAAVDIGASSRDQATILFNQAGSMVERSKMDHRSGGPFKVQSGYRHIHLVDNKRARIRVHPADAKTVDGVIPTLALVDELHRHPNGDLYGVFRDGLDARDGLMVTMSTAGITEESPLGKLRRQARDLPSFCRKGAYSSARSADGSFVLHEWSLTDEDDLANLNLVKKANPASWQTIPKLRRRKESPAMTPSRWARFACGVWTEGEESWLEPKDWDRLKVDIGKITKGEPVWASVVTGTNPAIVLASPRSDERVAVLAHLFEGDVPLEELEKRLVELSGEYELRDTSFDKAQFLRSAELLEQRGLTMTETPHSPERMSIVTQTLRRLIDGQKLLHDGDQELRTQVLSGSTKETERGIRLVNTYRTRGLVAMAFAVHRATQVEEIKRKSKYEDEGMAVV